jgi:hypothetical protein
VTDRDLILGFDSAALEASAFRHSDHVRVAWHFLKARDFFEAAARMRSGLRALAKTANAANLYNETITLAFLALIHERMAGDPAGSFADFAARNPDLFDKTALTRFYAPERLASPLARSGLILPDRVPAP